MKTFGITWIGRGHIIPSWELFRGPYGTFFCYFDCLGFSFWRNTLPAQTVAERGAW